MLSRGTIALLILAAPGLALLACSDDAGTSAPTTPVDPDGGAVEGGSGEEGGPGGDTFVSLKKCTPDDVANVFRMKVHPQTGDLYVYDLKLRQLRRLRVTNTEDTCKLEEEPGLVPIQAQDFDFDAAGNLYTLRAPEEKSGKVTVEKRDAKTGAVSGVECTFDPGPKNVRWGHIGVSPDGTKAVVVSSLLTDPEAPIGPNGTYAATVTIEASSCTAVAWKPELGNHCLYPGFEATATANLVGAVRVDASRAYVACGTILAFDFGATAPTLMTVDKAGRALRSLTLSGTTLDVTDSAAKEVVRFDGAKGAQAKTFPVTTLLGVPTGDVRQLAMTDPWRGRRYVLHAIVEPPSIVSTQQIFRLPDF